MDRNVLNMQWGDSKHIDMGIHPCEWFCAVFPVWTHQKIPDTFQPLKKFVQWYNINRKYAGVGTEDGKI